MRNRKREEKIGNGIEENCGNKHRPEIEENRRAKERNRKEMAKRGGEMSSYGKEKIRNAKDRRGVEQKWRRELQREAGEKISREGISVGEGEHRLE